MDEDTTLLYSKKKSKTVMILGYCLGFTCFLLVTLIIFVIGGILTTYFLWPRIPEATIENEKQQNYTINNNNPLNPSMSLYFTFDIRMDNDNYFDIDIDNVDLDVQYQGATMGNITQIGTINTLESRTANQTIPMQAVVTFAPFTQIQEMLYQFSLEQVNIFYINGTVSISAISISLDVPVTSQITLKPSIIGVAKLH